MNPKFIVFEGLDGSGTSTQIERLKEQLDNVCCTFEPSEGVFGKSARAVLQGKNKVSAEALQLLFCADRADHLEKEIQPALDSGQHVICDRYISSTLAFGGLSLPIDWLEKLNERFLQPDLILFFDVGAEECLKRIEARGNEKEHFEKRELLEKVYENYVSVLRDDPTCVFIDATKTLDEVFSQVEDILGDWL